MKNFAYMQPENVEEACAALEKGGADALPFAGGTDALGLMKDQVIAPKKVVNLKALPAMREIAYTPGEGLRIGALVTITEIAEHPVIRERFSVLAQAASEVASPQLRNVGTVGGNLCQRPRCDYFRGDFHCARKGGDLCYAFTGRNKYHCVIGGGPCVIVHPSDLAVALLALDADVMVQGPGKEPAKVPLNRFYVLPEEDFTREHILEPGEILSEIRVPDLPAGTRSGYVKVKERGVWDFAVVSVAAIVRMAGNTVGSGRVAFGGVAPVPWQEEALNSNLSGLPGTDEAFESLSQPALADALPLEQNGYKIPMAHNMLKRMLMELCR
jgi:xanthine dehydrogenase YagS FAD-binding subunit